MVKDGDYYEGNIYLFKIVIKLFFYLFKIKANGLMIKPMEKEYIVMYINININNKIKYLLFLV